MAVAPIPFKTANLTFKNMHNVVTSSKKLELLKGSSSGEGKASLIEDFWRTLSWIRRKVKVELYSMTLMTVSHLHQLTF